MSDNRRRIIAVIHHRDQDTTIEQARIALEAGCWGAAVICMDATPRGDLDALSSACMAKRQLGGRLRMGVNALATTPATAFLRASGEGLDFTWVDDPGIRADSATEEGRQLAAVAADGRAGNHLVFAGAGFKTHGYVADPTGAAQAVARLGWIPTTSGAATGVPPTGEYLHTMSNAVKAETSYGLAVASGITPENAPVILQHVRWVLAATGVSRSFHEFEPERLQALVQVSRDLEATEQEAMLISLGFPRGVIDEVTHATRMGYNRDF